MNFRWHPETLNADGPDCGNDERFQLILRVDFTNCFVRLLFGAMEKLFRNRRGGLIAHAKLSAIRPMRELH